MKKKIISLEKTKFNDKYSNINKMKGETNMEYLEKYLKEQDGHLC